MAESLYRKYRPKTFDDVVGQDHIIKTLQNSIQNNKVSHAYLFCGPRGTGKTTTARILAKALLCERGPTDSPDGTCSECLQIAESSHSDVYELDAASRTGVDNVRDEIISRINYAPRSGKYKVYIIDEVHMLSTAAFNALLKTLEEPPDHVVFVLCTTDPQKVPETIHSRCQRFDFRPINTEELIGRLGVVCDMEGIRYEDEGSTLDLIARRSNGGLRDALTSLEQIIAYGNGTISLEIAQDILGRVDVSDTSEIVEALIDEDIKRAFEFVDRYMVSGADLGLFIDDLAKRIRDIYICKLANCDVVIEVSEAEKIVLEDQASRLTNDRIVYFLTEIAGAISEIKKASNSRLIFELLLAKMINAKTELSLEALAERISRLEEGAPRVVSEPRVAEVKRATKPQEVQGQSGTPVAVPEPEMKETAAEPKQVHEENKDFAVLWNQVKREMQTSAPSFGSILLNTTAAYDSTNNSVKVIFPTQAGFTFSNAQKPACRTAIVAALEKVGMRGINLEVVKEDGTGTKVRIEPKATPAPAPAVPNPAPVRSPAPVATETRVEKDEVQELQDILSDTFGSNVKFKVS